MSTQRGRLLSLLPYAAPEGQASQGFALLGLPPLVHRSLRGENLVCQGTPYVFIENK